ncbi:MAG: GntR family transcriptional regulator [Reyranella sp.]
MEQSDGDETAMDGAATERRTGALDGGDVASKSLGELAYETLLDRMLSKELAPGTVLQERALGDDLQISRTPIREALTRLESEGFVTRHAGRLLTVREIPVQELMEIFHVRSILEVEGVALAAQRIPVEKLAELRRLFESQMTGPIPDGGNHWDADDLLHGSIADASGSKVLADLVRNLRRKTRMFSLKRMPERFIPGSEEHLAIIAALERRDTAAARAAMALHLENSKRSILQILGKI